MSQDRREAEASFAVAADGTVLLDRPVQLPKVLDALIVGGGPFGTAAAFRAKELGINALVIECDDLMRRIRDYAKDKQILPDYGGGDRMQFPAGGPLIRALQFAPIDKDRMCVEWKSLYRIHSVPAQIGIELTSLERSGDHWRAITWNHNLKSEQVYEARHVVLAFGRGVPRRLNIPGDVAGLAFGLTSAEKYVGQPACVIGGGTSAGEAVIAISNAKAAANDPTKVYWSYRGDKMPKVSLALATEYFQAFTGNGNIEHLLGSEPVAIIEQSDEPFLLLRTSRVTVPDRPTENKQLEFRRSFCIACIGEDIPTALLARLGTPLVSGGPENKTRPLVTPVLETIQPNLYLAGDVLSPSYFETTDFNTDPSQFKQVSRRGNIKAALRDGVLIAEVIAQKLAGRVQIDVQVIDEPAPAVRAAASAPRTPGAPGAAKGCLVGILPSGVEDNEYALRPTGATRIGGRGADVAFPDDAALATTSALIVFDGSGYTLQDESNGNLSLLVRAEAPKELPRGAVVGLGRQWLVVGKKTPTSVAHYNHQGERQGSYELRPGTTIVGRQSPDITIAPDDAALSRRHLSLTVRDGKVLLRDLGSANGTQLRVSTPVPLGSGDRILIGQQTLEFRDETVSREPAARVRFDVSSVSWPIPAPAPAAAAGAASSSPAGPSVFFSGIERLAPCGKGQTICEAADKAGIGLEADCHQGVCGMDPVRVLSGGENLAAMTSKERSTLEDICSVDPRTHRLACMARVSGAVKVEIVKA